MSNFTAYDIKLNEDREKHIVPMLRFVDGDDAQKEELRNTIWNAWFHDSKKVKDIANSLGMSEAALREELNECRRRYDEWIKEYGLALYGEEAHRLEDHINDLSKDIMEINEILEDPNDELMPRDRREYMKLRSQFRAELAKFKGVTPAEKVSLEVSSAEVTRAKMAEMFPDD
jgi:predicted nuclease with TOPRIM domain